MTALYVTEPGAAVRRDGRSLVVTLDADSDGRAGPAPETRRRLAEIELHHLEAVMLFGRTHLTTDAAQACLRDGIAVAWFRRNGDYLGRLVPEAARSGDLRLLQYRAAIDEAERLAWARRIVAAKLANAAAVLRDVQSNRHGNPALAAAIADLARIGADAAAAESVSALLGVEGNAARVYFAGLAAGFRGDIGFERRRRRPPPDPANAMLSFGYVLLANLIAGLLEARGLDPAIGFFHELRPGRPGLALDLLEELRHPAVDRFVLRLANLKIMRPEMFEPDEEDVGGVRMTRDGLRQFLTAWEEHLDRPLRERAVGERLPLRAVLRRQVERLAADLRRGPAYEPVRFDA